MAKVLVSPLNWGLGHATRDIPIIRELLKRGHEVTIATTGRPLELLKKEFPTCKFINFPDFLVPPTKSKFLVPFITMKLPSIFSAIANERKKSKTIIEKGKFDLIISDNRFGVCHENVPSYFISHQLVFHLPTYMKKIEKFTHWFNRFHHLYFDGVIVPDHQGPNNLSGKLSHFKDRKKWVYYSGVLSSVAKQKVKTDIDYLFVLSGPEPQRTELEEIILSQIETVKGKKVVLLGKPEKNSEKKLKDGTLILSHATREKMAELMNRSKFIVTRSGYTTVMEIAELGKKALFIPTPGQTEQEYLSEYYAEKKMFYSVSQYLLDLEVDIKEAKKYDGAGKIRPTSENVKLLYDTVFKKHLE